MSPRPKTGPRPQRVEVHDAIGALLERTIRALGGTTEIRIRLREYTLGVLELVGVDTGGVTVTSTATPKASRRRLRRPGHDEDV